MNVPIDLTNQRFGRLLVLELSSHGNRRNWRCMCDCGAFCEVRADHLRSGRVVSCGCHRRQTASQRMTTHGLSKSRTYRIWRDMINRCHYEKYPERHLYGGRGISVCDRWRSSFENFLSDMGLAPEGRSIDRIDVNGNYAPQNCRWATALEQAHNRRM